MLQRVTARIRWDSFKVMWEQQQQTTALVIPSWKIKLLTTTALHLPPWRFLDIVQLNCTYNLHELGTASVTTMPALECHLWLTTQGNGARRKTLQCTYPRQIYILQVTREMKRSNPEQPLLEKFQSVPAVPEPPVVHWKSILWQPTIRALQCELVQQLLCTQQSHLCNKSATGSQREESLSHPVSYLHCWESLKSCCSHLPVTSQTSTFCKHWEIILHLNCLHRSIGTTLPNRKCFGNFSNPLLVSEFLLWRELSVKCPVYSKGVELLQRSSAGLGEGVNIAQTPNLNLNMVWKYLVKRTFVAGLKLDVIRPDFGSNYRQKLKNRTVVVSVWWTEPLSFACITKDH